MDHPLTQTQFAARLTAEDLVLINELIPELFPDVDLSVKDCLTGRQIIMALTERAMARVSKSKESKPEDLNRIKELEAELSIANSNLEHESQIRKDWEDTSEELSKQLKQLANEKSQLEIELSGISSEASEVKEKAQKLEKYVPVPNEMRIVLEPLTLALLVRYAEKVSRATKKEITPGEILQSLFVYYTTRREVEFKGFPLLITKADISELAKEIEANV